MRKRITTSTLMLFLLLGTAAQASWMGTTRIWVRIINAAPHRSGNSNRNITFRVIYWGEGGGHGNYYGKRFPGRTMTESVNFHSPKSAANVHPGMTGWIYHRAASWKTRRRSGSSKSWSWIGNRVWTRRTKITTRKPEDLGKAKGTTLLWAFRRGTIISLRIRYSTYGSYNHTFRLYKKANTLFVEQKVGSAQFRNKQKYGTKFFQFDAKGFKGKTLTIIAGWKKLVSFRM